MKNFALIESGALKQISGWMTAGIKDSYDFDKLDKNGNVEVQMGVLVGSSDENRTNLTELFGVEDTCATLDDDDLSSEQEIAENTESENSDEISNSDESKSNENIENQNDLTQSQNEEVESEEIPPDESS